MNVIERHEQAAKEDETLGMDTYVCSNVSGVLCRLESQISMVLCDGLSNSARRNVEHRGEAFV